MANVTFREVSPDDIDDINVMCMMPGSKDPCALRESAEARLRAAAMGAKVFGAFLHGEPVGRIEMMPIEAAPLPLEGDGLWVVRCLWVLEKAQGLGIARSLMNLGLDAAQGSKGVAVLTYPNWMPPSFFQKFGFEMVHRDGGRMVLMRKADPDAKVALARPAIEFPTSDETVRIDAVFNARCPWLMQYYRRCLERARSLSDRVITNEHIIHTHADALRWGEENLYIEGETPFSGPVRLQELERVVKEILARKKLL
ncbi:MAG: GNAT family N-acetyltransferase [Bacillota bacterium]